MAYKEGECAKCGFPIVVQAYDWSESNNYCTTCAWDKLMMIPEGVNSGTYVSDE